MTNVEVVKQVLERSGCMTSAQIASAAKRWFDYSITPSQASGALRSLMQKSLVASSNCGNGANVYWMCGDIFGTN